MRKTGHSLFLYLLLSLSIVGLPIAESSHWHDASIDEVNCELCLSLKQDTFDLPKVAAPLHSDTVQVKPATANTPRSDIVEPYTKQPRAPPVTHRIS